MYISLRNPTNARIGGFFGLGFVVILDDEATPNLRPGLGTVVEGDDGSVTLLVPVELSGPSGGVVTAEWATRLVRCSHHGRLRRGLGDGHLRTGSDRGNGQRHGEG